MASGTNILTGIRHFLAALAMAAVLIGQIPVPAEASVSASPAHPHMQSLNLADIGLGLSMPLEGTHAMHLDHSQDVWGDCNNHESGCDCENICMSSCPGQASVYPAGQGTPLDGPAHARHWDLVPASAESATLELHLPPPRL